MAKEMSISFGNQVGQLYSWPRLVAMALWPFSTAKGNY
jgi:hypothetical protein